MRVERRWIASVAGAAFLVGAMPFLRQMTAGQLNVALLAMLILSLGLMSRGFAIGGGVVLGVAAAFKISPLFSIVLLAAMRRRRAAIAASVAFGAILVVSIAAVGLDVHLDFLPVLRDMGYGRSTGGALFFRDHYNQSFNSLFHHLYAPNAIEVPPDGHRPLIDLGIGFGAAVANVFTFMASAAILSLLCILLWRRGAPPTDGRWSDADDALFHVGVLAMLLLPSLMWDHYAVQALAAMMALFGATATLSSKARATVAVVAFALLAIPVAHADPRWMTGLGRAVMFVRLWGMILMFALMALEAKRRIDARKAIC
jgi:hypothetical protein